MSVLITEASVDDISVIQAIAYKTWPATYDKILSAEQTKYMLNLFYSIPAITKQMIEENQHFLLASFNGDYVGYAGYEFNCKRMGIMKLHKLYILPETQGKNIGKKLIEKVIAKAKENKQTHLQLNVNRYNSAVRFYERCGFKIIQEEDIPIGNNYYMNDYIMKLDF